MKVLDTLDQIINRHESGRFVVLEISHNFIRSTNLFVKDNSIKLNGIIFKKIETDNIEAILNSLKIPQASKVIILGDDKSVVTFPAWVSVTRNDVKKEIDSGELENIISQAVWKFLNHYQAKAVAKLNVLETEIILANIRILGVRINKHKVLNPIGFKANTIEFLIEQTFINRDLFRLIESKIKPKSDIVFVSQIGVIESLACVHFFESEDKFNLLRLLPYNSLVLDINPKARFQDNISDPIISLKDSKNFNHQNLLQGIKEFFDIEEATASKIYDLYIEGKASYKMMSFLKDLVHKEWQEFSKSIKYHLKSKNKNYILADYSLLSDCLIKEPPLFNVINMKDIIEKAGFNYDLNNSISISTALSGLLGYHYSNREDELNKLAERRAKWLIP